MTMAHSGLYHLNCTPTIALPVSSVGGKARAMPAHRLAFPTTRGDGKSDPDGGADMLGSGSVLAANDQLHGPLGDILRTASD